MHLTLWYVVFICHQDNVSENYIGSVSVGGHCGVSAIVSSRLPCSLQKFVGFVVICSYVVCDCGDDG